MGDRSSLACLCLLAMAAFGLACAPEPAQQEEPIILETEDIDVAAEDEFDLSGDKRAAPRRRSSGQLPSDFPAGLPVYEPSSITDIGEGGLGGLVQFMAQAQPSEIRDWYRRTLPGAGWTLAISGDGDMEAAKGAQRVRISVEASGPGSTITVRY